MLVAGENVFEIKRAVNTLDDTGLWVVVGNLRTQFLRVAIAFCDENYIGSGKVGRRLTERAAGEHFAVVTERLFTVDEHDVLAAATKFPVLKSVIEQQCVAGELFDRIPTGLHAVLVYQHDHVLEIGGEHVGLITGGLRVQQQRLPVGNNFWGSDILSKQQFVQQPPVSRRWL